MPLPFRQRIASVLVRIKRHSPRRICLFLRSIQVSQCSDGTGQMKWRRQPFRGQESTGRMIGMQEFQFAVAAEVILQSTAAHQT